MKQILANLLRKKTNRVFREVSRDDHDKIVSATTFKIYSKRKYFGALFTKRSFRPIEYYYYNVSKDFPVSDSVRSNRQYFTGNSADLIDMINSNITKSEFFKGFFINNKFYSPSYYSVDAVTHLPKNFYFTHSSGSFFKDFVPPEYTELLLRTGTEIVSVNVDTMKVDSILFTYNTGDDNNNNSTTICYRFEMDMSSHIFSSRKGILSKI